jgi:hypothetical protein
MGILLQSFSSFVIVAHFEWNKKIIARTLCENKKRPQLKCNGKCHLRKQLKEQEKKEQSPVSPIKDKTEGLQYFEEDTDKDIFVHYYFLLNPSFSYLESKTQSVLDPVFHPPSI